MGELSSFEIERLNLVSGIVAAMYDHLVRMVIEEVKAGLPIWKRERYKDGSESWVECTHRFQM